MVWGLGSRYGVESLGFRVEDQVADDEGGALGRVDVDIDVVAAEEAADGKQPVLRRRVRASDDALPPGRVHRERR